MKAATVFPALENITQRLWFAVGVKPRHEKAVAEAFRASAIEYFAPVYRQQRVWSDRTKLVELPLFAGYVFSRFRYDERFRILNTRGVISILGGGKVFSPVSDEQIETLKTLVRSGAPARPHPYLAPGQQVEVERGPLAGIRGTVLRAKGTTCIVVGVEILQRSVAVEVDAAAVREIQPRFQPVAAAAAGRHVYAHQ